MTSGFGPRLMTRAGRIARNGVERVGEAMVAAAEAELPPGVDVVRTGDGVALTGLGVRARYWGTAKRAPGAGLRLLVSRLTRGREIGRASCRERVCQYVWISVVAVSVKKKKNQQYSILDMIQ